MSVSVALFGSGCVDADVTNEVRVPTREATPAGLEFSAERAVAPVPTAPDSGGRGQGAGAAADDGACPLGGGDFLLTEPANRQIGVYRLDGTKVTSYRLDHELAKTPTRIVRDGACNVLVADWQTYSVFTVDADEHLELTYRNGYLEEPIDMVMVDGSPLVAWNDAWGLSFVDDPDAEPAYVQEGYWVWAVDEGADGTVWVANEVAAGRLLAQYDGPAMHQILRSVVVPDVQSMRYDEVADTLVVGATDEIQILDAVSFELLEAMPATGRVYQLEIDEGGQIWRIDDAGLWRGSTFVMPVAQPMRSRFAVETH